MVKTLLGCMTSRQPDIFTTTLESEYAGFGPALKRK
jgi:hypothetical protein